MSETEIAILVLLLDKISDDQVSKGMVIESYQLAISDIATAYPIGIQENSQLDTWDNTNEIPQDA